MKKNGLISWLLLIAMFVMTAGSTLVVSAEEQSTRTAGHATTVVEESTGKKGIIASYWTDPGTVWYDDPVVLGVDHALFNIDMTDLVNTDGTGEAFTYNGKTYYYNNVEGKQLYYTFLRMQEIRDKGITLTAQVNMQWSDDPALQELIFPMGRESGHNYYALNTTTEESREVLAAAFHYLVTKCPYVNNWIVGCEINSPEQCNYCGTLDVTTNVVIAAQTYDLMYQAIQDVNPAAMNYVCLDNIWNFDNGQGIPAKTFLEEFAKYETNKTWHLAYHPYPVPYGSNDNPAEWNMWSQKSGEHGYLTHTEDTAFITGANIEVLSNFVKENYGSEHRIILTEFGFDSRAGEASQAAALYYTYKAAERDDMIDACIYQPWADNGWDFREMGILSASGEKRMIYDVFKYMDSDAELAGESYYMDYLNITDWSDNIIWGDNSSSSGSVKSFIDVKSSDFFYDPVMWAVEKEITDGTGENTFSPYADCSRGHVVTFLWRANGSPEPVSTESTFTDIGKSDYYYKAVLWAREQGITDGTSDTEFSPNAPCTRGQIVTFLWRSEKNPQPASNICRFTDVDANAYYRNAVIWAVENGITDGKSAVTFEPDTVCTRGETVTFLYRAQNS